MTDCEALLAELTAQRQAFEAERAEWAKERTMLLNAALTTNTGEFVMRQRASGQDPLVAVVPPKKADLTKAEVAGQTVQLVY